MVDIEERIEVVTVDKELAKYLGNLRKGIRTPVSVPDLIIGGSAVFLGAEVATRNKKHFKLIPGIKFY
ncbi:MAG: hypothetical protein UX80_C0021G0016 [Candidatus Amesbacteria bacterium GW2011_GWA2_47_11b]|uniref:PIN domain-containing protein n=1 Tax=Candidatus Amesbacteria bacterium GW2011_GWA2_47_11b TaxID=1618358 RepID=A0A0G1RJE6_9BACT|nr:MAG: hypothetical protein UX80_C0021G0016 [Candidatus Amesbacteria bacterium GW2011_GWA2_47_11b]